MPTFLRLSSATRLSPIRMEKDMPSYIFRPVARPSESEETANRKTTYGLANVETIGIYAPSSKTVVPLTARRPFGPGTALIAYVAVPPRPTLGMRSTRLSCRSSEVPTPTFVEDTLREVAYAERLGTSPISQVSSAYVSKVRRMSQTLKRDFTTSFGSKVGRSNGFLEVTVAQTVQGIASIGRHALQRSDNAIFAPAIEMQAFQKRSAEVKASFFDEGHSNENSPKRHAADAQVPIPVFPDARHKAPTLTSQDDVGLVRMGLVT